MPTPGGPGTLAAELCGITKRFGDLVANGNADLYHFHRLVGADIRDRHRHLGGGFWRAASAATTWGHARDTLLAPSTTMGFT